MTETPVNWRYTRKDALEAKNDGKMLLVTFDGERSSLIGKNEAAYAAYVAPRRPKSQSVTDGPADGRNGGRTHALIE